MTTAGTRLRILGGVDLRDASGREVRAVLTQPKRLALLAYLALAGPKRFIRRDTLIALFWPESDQDAARHALRSALHFLRQALGEDVFSSRGHEEIALGETGPWCDAVAFQEAIVEGKTADALRLYRGDLLEGIFVAEASPELEQWLDQERGRLRRMAAEAALVLAEGAARDGNVGLLRHWASRHLELSPDDEAPVRSLMAMLLRLGDRGGALHLYQDFASRLARDLEVKPSQEIQRFAATIREVTPVPAPIEAGTNQRGAPTAVPMVRELAPPESRRLRGGLRWGVVGAVVVGAIAVVIGLRRQVPNPMPVLAVGTIEPGAHRLRASRRRAPGSSRDRPGSGPRPPRGERSPSPRTPGANGCLRGNPRRSDRGRPAVRCQRTAGRGALPTESDAAPPRSAPGQSRNRPPSGFCFS
ncbi:MAG: AfsR/SARP family transcriptional regulator [Gemmatimonadales bacterium]